MNLTRILATARRVLQQLRHDPRTIALILIVPCLLEILLKYIFNDQPQVFNQVGASLLGLFPLTVMFIVTSIATLRERISGTLERLLTLPIAKLDLLLGYALAFGLLVFVQAALVSSVAIWILGLSIAGNSWLLIIAAIASGLLGMALGLCVSALAQSEFQAVQFMPALILPQVLLCGLLVPRDQMQPILETISKFLPLTYSIDAMQQVTSHQIVTSDYLWDILIVIGFMLAALCLGAVTLRRQQE